MITAKWPFFDAFRTFLTTLYRISISKSPLPLERYVDNVSNDSKKMMKLESLYIFRVDYPSVIPLLLSDTAILFKN